MINSVTLGNWTIIYNHKKQQYEAHRPDQEPVIGWDIIDVCHDAGTTNPTLDEYAALLRLQEKSDVVKQSTVDSTIVSIVQIGRGDGECIIAVTNNGKVYTGRPGQENRNQWGTSWSYLEWKENNSIPMR